VLPLLFIIPIGVTIFAITIVRAVIARVEGANFAGAGIFILLTSLLFKVLVYAGLLPPVHVLITVLDIAFIFTMSLVLGARFSLQFVKVETLQRKTEQQHYELEGKNKEVERQKEALEEKNKEILDSITYAKRIQHAILPSRKLFHEHFPGSFILYKPKDIVAGDFYFLEPAGGCVIFAVADCTGHGVPGALVSVVCSNALNRAVKEFGLAEPGQVLGIVRQLVTETFDKSESDVKDGMDISIFTFYPEQMELKWAGANNPLWLIQNNALKEISPTKQSIGRTDDPQPFSTHTIPIQKGDMIYLFTDGYADQFGGPRGKKFRYKQFQELVLSIHHLPADEQEHRLDQAFREWKSNLEQVDDVCVAGIRFT
jgi:serine phosphatase RsbU (regulator of sigma subunit)